MNKTLKSNLCFNLLVILLIDLFSQQASAGQKAGTLQVESKSQRQKPDLGK